MFVLMGHRTNLSKSGIVLLLIFMLGFCNKKPVFKKSTIAPVRTAAQLGSPPQNYTDNANESANFVLKYWVDFSKNSIPNFITELRSFTQQKLAEAEQAFYGAESSV